MGGRTRRFCCLIVMPSGVQVQYYSAKWHKSDVNFKLHSSIGLLTTLPVRNVGGT